jgi:HK97 gp10 family phage protein
MANVTMKIDGLDRIAEKFKRMPVEVAKGLDVAVTKAIFKVQAEAMKEAPVNKATAGGNLRQSIKATKNGLARGVVEVGAAYGIFVHEGTAPHIIKVKNKKVLANRRTNQMFGKIVRHPGTKANPFLQRAVDNSRDDINKDFQEVIHNIASKK